MEEKKPWKELVNYFVRQKVRSALNPLLHDMGNGLKEIWPAPTTSRTLESMKFDLLSMAKGAAIQIFDEQMARVVAQANPPEIKKPE